MRLFIAILFQPAMIDALNQIKNQLIDQGIEGVYSRDDMLHITLHYIGHCDEETLVKLRDSMNQISIKSFKIQSDSLGLFKRNQQKKLIYLGVVNNQALKACHEQVIHQLNAIGLTIKPYDYHPHITLVRKAIVDVGTMDSINVQSHQWVVDAIHIMESKRVNDRLIYESIHHTTLK